jgi:hypothetical protein
MSQYLYQQDYDNYGGDLLDVSRRAAMDVVAPHLQHLQQQNDYLNQRLAQEQRHRLDRQVAELVPNFREIDEDENSHRWLLGVDPMTGRVRQALLNHAIQEGNAIRVQAFFRQFRDQQEQGGGSAGAPRRPRPAASKPTYTRQQIGQLYEAHRKGAYANREAEWNRIEGDIFQAQREGRVVGAPFLTK